MAEQPDKNMSFLIVDDQFNVRRMIINFLRAYDYHNFVDAADGSKAWTKLQNNIVDFIICDYNMPYMSGFDVMEQIKSGDKKAKKATGFLMCKVIQKSKGQANPKVVSQILNKKLSEN